MYNYVHVTNVKVVDRQRVKRGEVIGDVWESSSEIWPPHVHLEILDDLNLDPLQDLDGCISDAPQDALVFPVDC
jgi:hypothetical protein